MRFIRTSPPPTAAHLSNEADRRRSDLAAMHAERAELAAAVADLIGDPAHDQVEARLANLDVRIPIEERILARIEAAIPVAEDRERRQAFAERKADLDRRTAKLARTAGKRFPELAGPLADLLEELKANDREWEAFRWEARDLGEEGHQGHAAEVRARIDLPGARVGGVYKSVLSATQIAAWGGGRDLYDGGLQRP